MFFKGQLVLTFSLLLVLASGCTTRNPNTPASISGKISYKGNPVKGGMIAFLVKDAGTYSSPIRPDGTYAINELPVGTLEVTIETESVNPNQKKQEYMKGGGSPIPDTAPGGGKLNPDNYVAIPRRYADRTKSGFTVTIAAGSQRKDFDLTD